MLLELLKETQIIFPEITDVIDPVSQHGDPLGAKAEGEPGVTLRVIATIEQDDRMDHAAAADFQPAAPANITSFTAAQETFNIKLCARFGEREK